MIHVNSLIDDYYYYNEETYEMIGEQKHRVFKLGQTIDIVVTETDKLTRTIDFMLAEDVQEGNEDGQGEYKADSQ